mmetsp:Transcript_32219/g.93080  ORF Transcript_32219/g.93080 Transcript_32219/m.93080 type:complete len:203 (-) Transcript_32219:522-1130(-)
MNEATQLLTLGQLMVGRDEIFAIRDGHGSWVILKRMTIECERVQDAAEHPDIHLLANCVALPEVELDVGHLRRSVQHGHRLVNLLLQVQELRPGKFHCWDSLGAARPEVAQLPNVAAAPQDVLDLQVPVLNGWGLGMQMLNGAGDLHENLQDLPGRKFSVTAIHEVEQVPTGAEFHENLDGLASTRVLINRVPQALDDARMG